MRKNFQISIFFILVLLSACTSNGYKISGTVDSGNNDSTMVYLKEIVNKEWNTIDSIALKGGKFSFSGECNNVKVAYLIFEPLTGESYYQPVVLEPGKITISIGSNRLQTTLSGSPQNDLLNGYYTQQYEFYQKVEQEYKQLSAEAANDSSKMQIFSQRQSEFIEEATAMEIEFIEKNINTVVGNFIFSTNYYDMTIEQKESIIAKMNDATKAESDIAKIIEEIASEKITSAGQLYIDFKLAKPHGGELALSDLVGKTDFLLVDFWASWCGPCIRSFPELKAFYNKYKGSKFEILGVSLDDSESHWLSAIESHGLVWQHVSDLKGWKSHGAELYTVRSIPATVLIDKNGQIVGRNLSFEEMEKLVIAK